MRDINEFTSDYKCIQDNYDKCPCGESIYLLLNTKTQSKLPSFYICFKCGYIGEAGVGKVIKKDKSY